MLIPSEIDTGFYCNALSKSLDVLAKGTVVIGRLLKPTSGNHFSQEIHVENLETSQEVRKAMEYDAEFHQEILIKLINTALEKAKSNMEIK